MATAKWRPAQGMAKVKQTLGEIQRNLDSDRIIDWALPRVREAIATRTFSGRDIGDDNFVPYSESYAKIKGRSAPVTLKKSGDMLGALKARKTGKASGRVSVGGEQAARAEAHHRGGGNVPVRKWLGMSPTDLKELNRDTLLFMERALRLRGPGLSVKGRPVFKGKSPWRVRNPQ